MQLRTQSHLSTFAPNKFPQNLEFLCATRLDTARIVKNVTRMIGEHKFVIDAVFASLAPCLGTTEEKCNHHLHPWMAQV
jgi:hypothetical protein